MYLVMSVVSYGDVKSKEIGFFTIKKKKCKMWNRKTAIINQIKVLKNILYIRITGF